MGELLDNGASELPLPLIVNGDESEHVDRRSMPLQILFALTAKADWGAKNFVNDHGILKAATQQATNALPPCQHLGCNSSHLSALFNTP